MLPIEALSDIDKNKIKDYASLYGGASYICPIDRLLRIWNQEKTDLFEKMGNKLIISYPIEYEASESQISSIINSKLFDRRTTKDEVIDFINNFYNATSEARILWPNTDYFGYLLNTEYLAKNRINKNYKFILKNGKTYRVEAGTKVMKVIRKIAESYHIDNFDAFCNEHSLCLNQKTFKGELCISIHPLDYMTMSDNNSNWHTCMSWINDGEYRQGTIEMMNSPCVVVAYLKGEEDWCFDNTNTWNDKKWRCLFIVDNNMILSIKNYPYFNSYLTKMAITKIAEAIGWGDIKVHNFNHDCDQTIDGHNVCICTETYAMYNDFQSTDHFIGLNPSLKGDIYDNGYCYSGPSMCIQCGGLDDIGENEDENRLTCNNCNPKFYCDCCGDPVYTNSDKYTWISGDTILCRYCADHELCHCPITDNIIYKSESYRLLLCNSAEKYVSTLLIDSYCWHDEPDKWKKYFNIEEPHSKTQGWTHYNWVNEDELTEAGKQLFKELGIPTNQESKSESEDELPF